jgi:hypothetical protein
VGVARNPKRVDEGGNDVDMTTIAAFVAFLALVVAWMAAPTDTKRLVATIEPSAVGAD